MNQKEKSVLYWTAQLSGIEQARLLAGHAKAAEWALPAVDRHLGGWDMDSLVSATLLAEGVDELVAAGVEKTRLIGKLRGDPDHWPTWAEIRAAAILLGAPGSHGISFEPDRAAGRHSDYLFFSDMFPNGVAVEFKALGLSDEEARFCDVWSPQVARLGHKRGLVSFHAPLGVEAWQLSPQELREIELEAEQGAQKLPPHLRRLSGASVIAHGTEESYLVRLRRQLESALGQVPRTEGLIALHWSNGAPIDLIRAAASTVDLPANVLGLVMIGSVLFVPAPLIHNFILFLPAPHKGDAGETEFRSAVSAELAKAVLGDVDRAAGVRATVLRAPGRGQQKKFELVRRDGRSRLYPYNLLLDKDPAWGDPHARLPVGEMRRLRGAWLRNH